MSTFKDFLAENAHQGFDLIAKLHSVDDLLDAHNKYVASRLGYVKAFEDAVKADETLYNVVHSEAKDAVKDIISRVYEKIVSAGSNKWTRWDGEVHKQLDTAGIDITWHLDAGNAKKADRSLTAAQKLVTDADCLADFAKLHRLVTVFLYCIDAFKATQTKVVKGRKPAEPDPNAFHSRMGSAHAVSIVRTALLKSITPILDEFQLQVQSWFDKTLGRVDAEVNGRTEIKPIDNPYLSMIFSRTYSFHAHGWDDKRVYKNVRRDADADDYPKREAASQRKTIEEAFLHKNALKLSALLDKKGNLTSIDVLPGEPVRLHDGAGTLTSVMKATFADGSEFTVRNKVIINRSGAGREFYQYPTTFHDVKLPDGSKLESPSEEKMIKVFGG